MASHGQFLCGCKMGYRSGYAERRIGGTKRRVQAPDGFEIEVWEGGIQVCPEHGELPYGYLSGPKTTGPQGNQITDYSRVGSPGKLRVATPEKDLRDNRDPEEIGKSILALRNGRDVIAGGSERLSQAVDNLNLA